MIRCGRESIDSKMTEMGEQTMLKAQDVVVVVVDVQGKLATLMYRTDEFVANVVKMLQGVKVLGIPVLWNEQIPDKLGSTIHEIRDVLADMTPMVKATFSCCGNDAFSQALTALHRKQVLLVGMETHVCVYQTALDLKERDYEVYLVEDAVSSRTLENKRIGIEAMREAGVRITGVEMALFEMLRVAEGRAFKQIIEIVR
jgi:nicotinamidase-related amidase